MVQRHLLSYHVLILSHVRTMAEDRALSQRAELAPQQRETLKLAKAKLATEMAATKKVLETALADAEGLMAQVSSALEWGVFRASTGVHVYLYLERGVRTSP